MATPFLLESPKIKWNPFLHTSPNRCYNLPNTKPFINVSSDHNIIRMNSSSKFSSGASNLRMKCSIMDSNVKPRKEEENVNRYDILARGIMKALKALRKPAITALLLGLLLLYVPTNSAMAASGGRIGGRSFSSSSSRSSSSRSYSTRSSSSSSSSRLSSSSSYRSAPYYVPSPIGEGPGVYIGPALGIGSSSFFIFFIAGIAAFILVSGFLSDEGSVFTATERTSVLKLQVGLLGMARSLQTDLNRIAETADTSSSKGLSYVLTETALSLLRHPDYCISGYSSVDVKRSTEEGEKRFNQLSIEERGKFDEETLVNVNNIRKKSSTSQRANGFINEYIVITILVAAEGVYKLPAINSSGDLKRALQKLGSIPSSRTLAVEVLWTPQNEGDTLSERELLEDYSLLRPL